MTIEVPDIGVTKQATCGETVVLACQPSTSAGVNGERVIYSCEFEDEAPATKLKRKRACSNQLKL